MSSNQNQTNPKSQSGTSQTNNQTTQTKQKSVLFLTQSHVTFQAPSQKVSVFFDECNREVINLTNVPRTCKTEVVIQSTETVQEARFLLPIEKRILSIKLNPKRTVLAYHVERSTIEFINVKAAIQQPSSEEDSYISLDEKRYTQASLVKNSKLLGFIWTGASDIVMITDISVEYYHVEQAKRRLKHMKSFQSSTNWFVYQPQFACGVKDHEPHNYSLLMISTGSLGNSMQPYLFSNQQCTRLQRFEVEGNWQGRDRLELFERSITISAIYGQVRLLMLQHESLNFKSRGAQILLYTVDHESGITTKTHTLDLDISGRFAINILDNLVIAHDQPSKTSFIFDIRLKSTEKSDCPDHFVSISNGQPITPFVDERTGKHTQLYSLNWVFFQPNFIIDAKKGTLHKLNIDLETVTSLMNDNVVLMNFLIHRTGAQDVILDKCKRIVLGAYKSALAQIPSHNNPLAEVSSVFEVVTKIVMSPPQLNSAAINEKIGNQRSVITSKQQQQTDSDLIELDQNLSQEDIYRRVLRQFDDLNETTTNPGHAHFVSSAILEFIFLVRANGKNVDYCIYEQLMKCLISDKKYFQIIQLIRADIFVDSKQLACMLLSLGTHYKPATQLGLDMLERLNCLTDLIENLNLKPSEVNSVST